MSASGNLWAVVPVKLFADTKRRLMPVLESDERAALARTMLEDVLSVLTRTLSLAGIMVITRDAAAANMVRQRQIDRLLEMHFVSGLPAPCAVTLPEPIVAKNRK